MEQKQQQIQSHCFYQYRLFFFIIVLHIQFVAFVQQSIKLAIKMSSIMSDLFYNPTKKAIIDQYLLNQQPQHQPYFHPQSHSYQNIYEGQQAIPKRRRQTDKQLKFSQPSQLSQYSYYQQNTYMFIITVCIQIPKTYSSLLPSSGIFKQNSVHILRARIGINHVQQQIRYTNDQLFSQLKLQTTKEQFQREQVLSIQLYNNKTIRSTKLNFDISNANHNNAKDKWKEGCCYIPLQNIRKMLQKNQTKKKFQLKMKMMQSQDNQQHKFKVLCQLSLQSKIKNYPPFIQNQDNYNHIPPFNTGRQPGSNPSDFLFKQQQVFSQSKIQKIIPLLHTKNRNNPFDIKNKKQKETVKTVPNQKPHFKKNTINFTRNPSNKEHSISQLSINESGNTLLRYQLQNKPITFIINDFKSKNQINNQNNKQQIKQKYMFVLNLTSKKIVKLGQPITIYTSEIDNKGITIGVQEKNQGVIGHFILSTVVLLGGYVEGTFPVCTQNLQCIGIVRLNPNKNQMNNQRQKQIRQSINLQNPPKNDITQQQQLKYLKPNLCGCILNISKLYLLPSFASISYSSTAELINQLKQYTQQILLRLPDGTLKLHKNSSIKQQGQLIEICLPEPIIAYNLNKLDGFLQFVEIEVYIEKQLVAYSKLKFISEKIKHNRMNSNKNIQIIMENQQNANFKNTNENAMKNQKNILNFQSAIQNFTTDGWICNCIINYALFNIEIDYFPTNHIQTSLRCAVNTHLSPIFANITQHTTMEQLTTQLIKKIKQVNQKILYIQAYRIANLLISSYVSNNYTFLKTQSKFTERQHTHYYQSKQNLKQKQLLTEQIRYLDEQGRGYIKVQDLQNIRQYYGISRKDIEIFTRSRLSGQCKQNLDDQVMYLFLLAEIRVGTFECKRQKILCKATQQKEIFMKNLQFQQENKRMSETSKQIQIPKQTKSQQIKQEYLTLENLKITSQNVRFNLLLQIQSQNLQNLMSQYGIPSIRIHIPSQQYTSRTYYSCANPTIRVNKKIQDGQIIVILHNDIKMQRNVEIGRVLYEQGKYIYNLKEGAFIKLKMQQ